MAYVVDGETITTREPELDWVDRDILLAWAQLQESACQHCGRPRALHEKQQADDYNTGFSECPAMEAIDASQARIAENEDAQARKDGRNPERWRTWHAWTDDEPTPD